MAGKAGHAARLDGAASGGLDIPDHDVPETARRGLRPSVDERPAAVPQAQKQRRGPRRAWRARKSPRRPEARHRRSCSVSPASRVSYMEQLLTAIFAKAAVALGAHLDPVAAGTEHAVGDYDILGEPLRAALEHDGVVAPTRCRNPRCAPPREQSISMPSLLWFTRLRTRMPRMSTRSQPQVVLHPHGRVDHGHAGDRDVRAFDHAQQIWTHLVRSGEGRALAVDGSAALDGNPARALGPDQRPLGCSCPCRSAFWARGAGNRPASNCRAGWSPYRAAA